MDDLRSLQPTADVHTCGTPRRTLRLLGWALGSLGFFGFGFPGMFAGGPADRPAQ